MKPPLVLVLLWVLLALLAPAAAGRTQPKLQRRLEAHLSSGLVQSDAVQQLPQVGAAAAAAAAGSDPSSPFAASGAGEVGHPLRVPLGRACSAPLAAGGMATGTCMSKCPERTYWVVRDVCSFLSVCCIAKVGLKRPALPTLTPGTGPGWWSEAPRSPFGMSWGQSPATTTPAFASGGLHRVVFHTVLKSPWVPDLRPVSASVPPFDSGVVCASKLPNTLPHFSVKWERDTIYDKDVFRVWQHIPITHAASALQHQSSLADRTGAQCETNRAHAIQIEIVDMSEVATEFPKEILDGIGRLLRWLKSQTNVQAVSPASGFQLEAQTYGEWAGRMTCAEWAKFNGVCGHSHVPCNKHGDPGPLNIAALLQRMKA